MNALLIPIYEPTERVVPFLSSFQKGDFDAFLVVDDGSGEAYRSIFEDVAAHTVFDVVSYPVNRGKGFALKHGLRTLLQRHPELDYVVTADGDGQHLYEDIKKVSQKAKECPFAVILGSRDFADAPPKSVSGNRWSARYFFIATGKRIRDCQTGLRAIPRRAFDMALGTYGNRFDYEMNFLLPASREFGFIEEPITTVYEDGNKGTHFRPVADSLLIMRTPIAYLLVGILSLITTLVSFHLFRTFVFTDSASNPTTLLWCHLLSWLISFPFNYFMLSYVVFHHKYRFHNAFYKYFVLSLTCCLTSYFFSWLFSFFTPLLTLVKAVVDIILGIVKYEINLLVTFANRTFGRDKRLH